MHNSNMKEKSEIKTDHPFTCATQHKMENLDRQCHGTDVTVIRWH